jgi:phospholipase/carboxylesterase
MLILLHGLAADENDLIGLADELGDGLAVISLRAPYKTGYGGYCWFPIDFLPDGGRIIDETIALQSLGELILEIERLTAELRPRKVVLGGFSQGAMMAAGVLFQRPDLLSASWLMSGRLVSSFNLTAQTVTPIPVLQQHGLYDDVLPVEEGRELAAAVRARGHLLTYVEYAMAHQISYESLVDAAEWFKGI